jgi:hypothetical protein
MFPYADWSVQGNQTKGISRVGNTVGGILDTPLGRPAETPRGGNADRRPFVERGRP